VELKDVSRMSQSAQRQILAKIEKAAQGKNKYHAMKTVLGNLKFDSTKEARRYQELMLLLHAGKIRRLKVQPEYTLQEAYTDPETGERIRAMRYRADFSYERETAPDANGITYWLPIVEDVKSPATKTQLYRNKAKLLREKCGITIREV
jgi:hypothetical protein